jgi:glycosyltransferase involved in cell wall biosynthesis
MKCAPVLSIVACAHNPREDHFAKMLHSIRYQDGIKTSYSWELVIIDNASDQPLASRVDLSWHPFARIVREERLGLTYARIRAFHETRGEILVFVDDDNVLDLNYIRRTFIAFDADPLLGAIGGKVLPIWERKPPPWFEDVGIDLACRDLGERRLEARWDTISTRERIYPLCAPVGAGMALRRSAYLSYIQSLEVDPAKKKLGRRGTDLSSGEDNDIIITVLKSGWKIAYLPDLRLEHLIPTSRLTEAYLKTYAQKTNRTWVQVLFYHGISPWGPIPAWSAPLRKMKAWFLMQAWAGPANNIRWRAACGLIDGRADIAMLSERIDALASEESKTVEERK